MKGSAPGQLNYPWGIAVSRISESISNKFLKFLSQKIFLFNIFISFQVFVCDKENDSNNHNKIYIILNSLNLMNLVGICVFHMSGRFLRSFGTHGTRIGQFDKPYYIHITKDNKVLVSDCSNHRIQVFGK